MARLPGKGWAKQSPDPVLQEIYRALAYHENTPPGSLIEFSCQRCPAVFIGGSPRLLAANIYDHMRANHPEAWKEPIQR
jgi:sugar (pentulose or hexulose) kinase